MLNTHNPFMLAGLISAAGELASMARGLTKVAMGLNPLQPLDVWMWVKQLNQGQGMLNEARADSASPSIMDNYSAPNQSVPHQTVIHKDT